MTRAPGVKDQYGGNCLPASSVPTLGWLYPISSDWFVDGANGRVGIGNVAPETQLDVGGTIRSRSGGIEFPDGTTRGAVTVVGPDR